MGRKQKSSVSYDSLSGVADALHDLADQIQDMTDKPDTETIDGAELFRKMEVSIKHESGRFSVKVKTRFPDHGSGQPTESQTLDKTDKDRSDRPKYKHLKKRMQRRFKEIKSALAAKTFPSNECVTEFLQDSELMVSYPGYGDDHYESYKQLCRQFQTAFTERDLQKLEQSFLRLKRSKSDCHDHYK